MEPGNPAAVADPAANVQQDNAGGHFFKLPDFWPASPLTWFGIVEAQFDLRGVTSQREQFSLVAAVLPESSARKITHLLAAPPADCYTALKAALLQSHVLTDMQGMELLFNMDNLGSKRPMDLLTEMLELVKPGEEKTQLFAHRSSCLGGQGGQVHRLFVPSDQFGHHGLRFFYFR